MRKAIYTILFTILTSYITTAITLYPTKLEVNSIYYSDSSALHFKFYNNNFLWNNEYFNGIIAGYTLIGYNISPTVQYHFSLYIKVELGADFLKYSGIDSFSNILPRYAVVYHKNRWSFTMGSLHSDKYHKLHDAVYNYERNFTNYQENGVQYRIDRERFFLDVWLDWQEYLFKGENKQEKLVAGISANLVLLQKGLFTLAAPTHFLVAHKGGQINVGNHKMLTAYNYGTGINANQQISNSFFSDISADFQYFGFTDNSPEPVAIYSQGDAFLTGIKVHRNNSFFSINYWYANQYLSLIGNPIYQCFSDKGDDFHAKERQLINGQIYYAKKIYSGINLGIMGELFYDLNNKYLDYSMGVKITIDTDFFITKISGSN